jgi:hypothetical protein
MRQPVDLDRQRGKAKSCTAQALVETGPLWVPKAGLAL